MQEPLRFVEFVNDVNTAFEEDEILTIQEQNATFMAMLTDLRENKTRDSERAGEYLFVLLDIQADWQEDKPWPDYVVDMSVMGLTSRECYGGIKYSLGQVPGSLAKYHLLAAMFEEVLNRPESLRSSVRRELENGLGTAHCTYCEFSTQEGYDAIMDHELEDHPEHFPDNALNLPVDILHDL